MRQYIGARYVPKFADPILHDSTRSYEAFEIVQNAIGDSFTSKKPVPVGVALTDTTYWVSTGNYNSQLAELAGDLNGKLYMIESTFDTSILSGRAVQKKITSADFLALDIKPENSIIVGTCAYNHASGTWWSKDTYPAEYRTLKHLDVPIPTASIGAGEYKEQQVTGLSADKDIVGVEYVTTEATTVMVTYLIKGSNLYLQFINEYSVQLNMGGVVRVYYYDPTEPLAYIPAETVEAKIRYDLNTHDPYLQVNSVLPGQYGIGDKFRVAIYKFNNILQM